MFNFDSDSDGQSGETTYKHQTFTIKFLDVKGRTTQVESSPSDYPREYETAVTMQLQSTGDNTNVLSEYGIKHVKCKKAFNATFGQHTDIIAYAAENIDPLLCGTARS